MSFSGVVSINSGQHQFPMSYVLMFVTALYLSNGFLDLIQKAFERNDS